MNTRVTTGLQNIAAIDDSEIKIGSSEKIEVFSQDKVTLYRYKALTDTAAIRTPILLVFGLVGHRDMVDMHEDQSFVRSMLELGTDIYVIDWGECTRADRWLTLEDYIDGYLVDSVEFIKNQCNIDRLNILGVCQGGFMSLCYAARYPEQVKNLITTVTPVDFHGDLRHDQYGLINIWARSVQPEDVDAIIDAYGNMPSELISLAFSMMLPVVSMTKYNIGLLDIADNKKALADFLRFDKWLSSCPDHPGEAAKQWFKDCYQDNKLVLDEFSLGGEIVDLKKIDMPVLNIYALNDHIIPPPCSAALEEQLLTKDYTDMPLPGGHVGIFAFGESPKTMSEKILGWLKDRD